MGWQTTPPTLPTGSSYKDVGSWNVTANKYSTAGSIAIARLGTNQVSIRFIFGTNDGSTSVFAPPGYMDFKVGDDVKSYGWGARISRTVYWTGTLNAGSSVKVLAGAHDSGSAFSHATYLSKNATGPDYVTTYAVAYNANGGSGSTASQTKTYGTALTLRQNGYTRDGYAFTGWNTASDGSGTAYAAGASYTANAAVTLYAQWLRMNIPVFVNVGGSVRQVEKAYANIGGVIKECDVYANIGGTVKPIK